MTKDELIDRIEYTILKPVITRDDIKTFENNIIKYGFKKVCVPSSLVSDMKSFSIKNKLDLEIVTVVGFPFGYNTTFSKAEECKNYIDDGANHLDVVINTSYIKMNRWSLVLFELRLLKHICKMGESKLKIIFEICYLTPEEIVQLCELCNKVGVDYVKTSTGFGPSGADPRIIKLMRNNCNDEIKIKASGGISSYEIAEQMFSAGADVIGCSNAVKILEEFETKNSK